MSVKADLFVDLKARILAMAPEIKTVKRWNNQIEPENDDREDPIEYPAVYIAFSRIIWEQYQVGIQKGDIVVTIHTVPEKYNTEDEEFYDTLESVHLAVQNYEEEYFIPLIRLEDREDDDHDIRIDYQTDYTSLITDCSTIKTKDLVETSPDLVLDIELDIDQKDIRTGDGVL